MAKSPVITSISIFIHLIVLHLAITSLHTYPIPRMRICIQSVDPSRLPSQCIYCKSRVFPLTVRLCTGNPYLPARMTLQEATCLTATCRKQLPRLPPEPYSGARPSIYANTNANANINSNTNTNANEDISYNTNPDPTANEENYEEAESLMAEQPTKVRPPAKFFLGSPQKLHNSIKPLIFG